MRTPSLREIAMLLVSGGMVVLGSLGLAGNLGEGPALMTALLVMLVAVAVLVGRQSMRLDRF